MAVELESARADDGRAAFSRIPDGYVAPWTPKAVEAFLEEHAEVIPLLREALPEIERCFGAGAVVTLDIFKNPETDEPADLMVEIEEPGSIQECMEKIRNLHVSWWLNKPLEQRRHVLFDSRPV